MEGRSCVRLLAHGSKMQPLRRKNKQAKVYKSYEGRWTPPCPVPMPSDSKKVPWPAGKGER